MNSIQPRPANRHIYCDYFFGFPARRQYRSCREFFSEMRSHAFGQDSQDPQSIVRLVDSSSAICSLHKRYVLYSARLVYFFMSKRTTYDILRTSLWDMSRCPPLSFVDYALCEYSGLGQQQVAKVLRSLAPGSLQERLRRQGDNRMSA